MRGVSLFWGRVTAFIQQIFNEVPKIWEKGFFKLDACDVLMLKILVHSMKFALFSFVNGLFQTIQSISINDYDQQN